MNLSQEIVWQIESIIGQCAPEGVACDVTVTRINPASLDNKFQIQLVMRAGNRSKTLVQEVDGGYAYADRNIQLLAQKLAEGANALARKMLAEIDRDPRFYDGRAAEAKRAQTQAEQHLDDEIAALERLL